MITLKGISKKFDSRGIAGLHHLNLSLGKGQILALMGPNGSGKSTLLNIISGKLKADSGEVKLQGDCLVVDDKNHVEDINQLQRLMTSKAPSDSVRLKYYRRGKGFSNITLGLEEMPKSGDLPIEKDLL